MTGAGGLPWRGGAWTGTVAPDVEIVCMERDAVIRLEKTSRVKNIRIKKGIAWLTATPANEDILLQPGEPFELRNAWPFVLQALEETEVALTK